jgi:hypothetical protein
MCYDHDEDIKSYFLTSQKPKKQEKGQNNAYSHSWNEGQKWLKIAFFWFFFPKTIVKIDTSACKMQIFAM